MPELASIVIPCRNEGGNVAMTVNSMLGVRTNQSFEIIIVDDGSEDGCCDFLEKTSMSGIKPLKKRGLGSANARNVGADAASGDVLIFCDAHITVEDGWLDRLLGLLRAPEVDAACPAMGVIGQPEVVGYGQTWDEELNVRWMGRPDGVIPSPLAPGACLAVKRAAFYDVGGFERGFQTWGHEDTELSLKLWLFNHPIYLEPDVTVLHLFRPSHPYRVTMREYRYNLLRMAVSHFGRERIAKVLQMVLADHDAKEILADLAVSDVWQQRADYLMRRTYDDDWFMERFGIKF